MHVLFLAPHYSPDLGPSAPLFKMLSEYLVQRGHKVTVITTVPHYPSGRVAPEFRGIRNFQSMENGVELIRIALPSMKRSNLIYRLAQYLCYQFRSTLVILSKDFDVVLAANPALWVWLPFFWSVSLRRKPAVLSIYDVYPDVGIVLGIFRHKPVIRFVAALERFCLDNSQVVHILSDSFRQGIRALGVDDAKMKTIHVWVDTDFILPMPKENTFSREHNLADKFVVLYAGNLGRSQGLEYVIEAAKRLEAHNDIQFVFVGSGNFCDSLVKLAEADHLNNIVFLPFQPRVCLPEIMASADVSLVCLRKMIGTDSMPSKIFSILASGRPVLASIDENSEAWNLILRANAGLCVPPEDPVRLAEAILKLKQNAGLRADLGNSGRSWAVAHHSPEAAAENFENLLLQAVILRNSNLKPSPNRSLPKHSEKIDS
jgi:colanic acid biosynthesis glycosyl transferase WcaI